MSGKCDKCGDNVPEDASYCPNCGEKTENSGRHNLAHSQILAHIRSGDCCVGYLGSLVSCHKKR